MSTDIILIAGDYAGTYAPFVSPKRTARFLTPHLKKQVENGHSMDRPVIKHTDGNILPIIDLLLETGIDGLHPIDPWQAWILAK